MSNLRDHIDMVLKDKLHAVETVTPYEGNLYPGIDVTIPVAFLCRSPEDFTFKKYTWAVLQESFVSMNKMIVLRHFEEGKDTEPTNIVWYRFSTSIEDSVSRFCLPTTCFASCLCHSLESTGINLTGKAVDEILSSVSRKGNVRTIATIAQKANRRESHYRGMSFHSFNIMAEFYGFKTVRRNLNLFLEFQP